MPLNSLANNKNTRVIHIDDSFNVWKPAKMQAIIKKINPDAETFLNRTFKSMQIEWWLHNIGYYISKPLKSPFWKDVNARCKDVDLEEWR